MTMKPSELYQHRSKNLLGLDPLHLLGYRPLQGLILRRARLKLVSHLLDHILVLFTKSANTVPFLAAEVILYTYFTDVNCMSIGNTLAQAFRLEQLGSRRSVPSQGDGISPLCR